MFDFIFNIFEAWNQVGLMLMGSVFILIGGGLAGYELAWRLRAKRIKGIITEVRVKENNKKLASRTSRKYSKEEKKQKNKKTLTAEFKDEPVTTSFAVLIVALFIGLPLIFSAMGVYMGYSYLSLTQNGKYAKATVIRNDSSYSSDNGTSYKAVLRFTDQYGKTWEVKDNISYGNSPSFSIGTKIGVYYDPKDPNEFVIDDFWHNMGVATAFTAFGFVFIGFILLGSYFNKKGKNNSNLSLSSSKNNFYNEMYRAVFEYKMPNGDRNQIVSDVSSNYLLNKIPGTRITLLMSQKNPKNVKRPSRFMIIFGLIFLTPGIFIMNMALTRFEFNIFTILMVLAGVGFLSYKIWSFISKISVKEFKKGLSDFRKEGLEVASSYSRGGKGERVLDNSEIMARVKVQARNSMIASYVMFVMVLALAGGAYFTGLNMLNITRNGISTSGKVVDLKSRYSSSSGGSGGGYTYYAVVNYTDNNGRSIRFEDNVGSSNPTYKRGDKVQILYLPDNTQGAIIDRGLMNWGLSGGLAIGSLLLLLMAFQSMAVARRYGRARYRALM